MEILQFQIKLRSISILKIPIILLLLFFVISKIVILPGFVSAILAFGWMGCVPFCLGNLFTKLPLKSIDKLSIQLCSIKYVTFPFLWSIGFLITTSVTYLSLISNLKLAALLGPTLLFVATVPYIVSHSKHSTRLSRKALTILIIGLILGIAYGGYVRSFSPYPLTPGSDVFVHFYVIKNILNNSIYAPLHYLPTFHILIALGSNTFNADLTEVFWIGSIILFSLFSISFYAMSYWMTKNQILALIGSVIGLSITEQGYVPNLQVFYPSSFVMSIFPLVFFLLDYMWSRSNTHKKLLLFVTAVILLGLILIHLELGTLAATIIISFLIISRKVEKNDLYNFIAKITTIYLTVILFMYFTGYLTSQIYFEAFTDVVNSVTYHFDVAAKNEIIKSWYTNDILTLSLLGLIALAFYKERKAMVLGLLASIILFIYYQDINDIHRSMVLERPLLSFAAAALVIIPVNLFQSYFMKHLKSYLMKGKQLTGESEKSGLKHMKENYKLLQHMENAPISLDQSRKSIYGILDRFTSKSHLTKLNILYVLVFVILLFPFLVKPYDTYLEPFFNRGLAFATFTDEELIASRWVEKNTPNNFLLYSDPFTVLEFRGLGYSENIPAIEWNQTVMDLVKSAMTSGSASDAYHNIVSNVGENTLIIITSRTPVWLHGSGSLVQFPVKKFEPFTGFYKFFDSKYFTLEYQSENIFIFTPKHLQ